MIQTQIAAWFAEKTLKFWLNVVGVVLILAILIAPSCMYMHTKADLEAANNTISQYKEAAKTQKKAEKVEVVKVEYKDKIIEKRVVQTKLQREIVYVNNEEAKDWGCTFIPDIVIGVSERDLSTEAGQVFAGTRALPDYCTGKSSGRTPANK